MSSTAEDSDPTGKVRVDFQVNTFSTEADQGAVRASLEVPERLGTMVMILGTFATIERFVLQRDEVDHRVDAVLPDGIDVLHACVTPEETWHGVWAEVVDATEPVFAKPQHFLEAACGRHVRVYLPEPFDSEHPKACQRCKDTIGVEG